MDSRQSGELERERSKRPVGRRDAFGTVDEAIESFNAGRMVIVVDDEDRENEGDLAIAAEKVTPDAINFMARYARQYFFL